MANELMIAQLNERITDLRDSQDALKQECKAYQEQIKTLREKLAKVDNLRVKADMMDILMHYVHDDADVSSIGISVVSFTDLYDKAVKHD